MHKIHAKPTMIFSAISLMGVITISGLVSQIWIPWVSKVTPASKANISARLAKLENARVASKGIRLFRSNDSVNFYESLGDGFDYNEAINGLDGNPPSDGRRMWTQDELDDLDSQGRQVIVLCYVNDWRGQSTGAV